MDAPIASPPAQEVAPQQPVNIAELMAKHGVQNDTINVVATPINIPEKKVEPPTEITETTAKVIPEKSETATPQTPEPPKVEDVQPPLQKEEIGQPSLSWQEVLKKQQPHHEQILKELGYTDELVNFMNGVKDIDPKVFGFLSTWKSGGDLNRYVREWTTDYSKMSAEDVMRHQLRQEYPKATPQQLDVLYNREVVKAYSLDSEDETELTEGRLLLEAKADKFRDSMVQNQQSYLMPKPPEPKADASVNEAAERQKDYQAYEQSVTNDAYTRNIISAKQISIGDGDEKFNFPLNTDEVMKMILDPDTWAAKFFTQVNDNGRVGYVPNNQKLWLVNSFANDPEKFLSEYAKHHQAIGAKSAVKEIESATPPATVSQQSAPEKAPQSAAEAMARYGQVNSGGR
jgi:hypothetical protein